MKNKVKIQFQPTSNSQTTIETRIIPF